MSGSGRSALAWCALAVALAVLLRFHPFLSSEASHLGHDWYHLHQVDATFVQQAASEGLPVPLWTSQVLGGTPLFAVPSKPFAYPPFLLGVLAFGPVLGMNLLLLAHLVLGGLGTSRLARRLDLAGGAPALCGVLFVLTEFPSAGFVSTPFSYGYAVAWWPFTLHALLDLVEGRRPLASGLLLGLFLALQVLAGGEPALLWFACFTAPVAAAALVRRANAATIGAAAVGALVALLVAAGLTAVKVLPALSWLDASGRGEPLGVEFARDSGVEAHLERLGYGTRVQTLAATLATLYRGQGLWVLAVACALGALVGVRRRLWWGIVLGSLFTFLLAAGTLHEWAYEWLPGYDRMRRHSRFVHVTGFGLVLLAGYGVHRLPRSKGVAGVALASVLAAAVLFDTSSLPGLRWSGETLGPANERTRLTHPVLEPVAAHPEPVRLHHEGFREQPAWIALGLESTTGALGGPRSGNADYHAFLPERSDAAFVEGRARGVLDVLNVGFLVTYDPLEHPHLELLAEPADLDAETLEDYAALDVRPFHLYRRTTSRPRACLVDHPTLVVGEPAERREFLRSALGDRSYDAHVAVYVEGTARDLRSAFDRGYGSVTFAGSGPTGRDETRPAEVLRHGIFEDPFGGPTVYPTPTSPPTRVVPLEPARLARSPRAIEVDVSGRAAGFLVLSELFASYDGWTATVDGRPAELLRADGVVTAVPLPEGAGRVELRFRQPGLALGAWITVATLAAAVAASLALRQPRRMASAGRRRAARQAG